MIKIKISSLSPTSVLVGQQLQHVRLGKYPHPQQWGGISSTNSLWPVTMSLTEAPDELVNAICGKMAVAHCGCRNAGLQLLPCCFFKHRN